jgi:uncharacterized protein (TIGR02001 family)
MTCRTAAAALMLAVASAAPAFAQDAGPWTVEGRIGAVSDYRDRGYTLSAEDPAVQGEVTVSHASGFYGGVWGSGIDDYGIGADGDGARIEVTLYAGWAGSVSGFDIDLGVWQNVYPDGDDVNYVEFPLQVGRTFGDTTLTTGVVWAPSQTGTGDEANTWVWTRAEYAPEAWPVSLHASLGHEDGGFAPDGKTDWRLGVAAPVGPFTLGVDWVDSDTEDSAVVASVFWGF